MLRSVGRRRYACAFGHEIVEIETLPYDYYIPYSVVRTPAGGLFGWGGTPLKINQRYLIVGSGLSEMALRG